MWTKKRNERRARMQRTLSSPPPDLPLTSSGNGEEASKGPLYVREEPLETALAMAGWTCEPSIRDHTTRHGPNRRLSLFADNLTPSTSLSTMSSADTMSSMSSRPSSSYHQHSRDAIERKSWTKLPQESRVVPMSHSSSHRATPVATPHLGETSFLSLKESMQDMGARSAGQVHDDAASTSSGSSAVCEYLSGTPGSPSSTVSHNSSPFFHRRRTSSVSEWNHSLAHSTREEGDGLKGNSAASAVRAYHRRKPVPPPTPPKEGDACNGQAPLSRSFVDCAPEVDQALQERILTPDSLARDKRVTAMSSARTSRDLGYSKSSDTAPLKTAFSSAHSPRHVSSLAPSPRRGRAHILPSSASSPSFGRDPEGSPLREPKWTLHSSQSSTRQPFRPPDSMLDERSGPSFRASVAAPISNNTYLEASMPRSVSSLGTTTIPGAMPDIAAAHPFRLTDAAPWTARHARTTSVETGMQAPVVSGKKSFSQSTSSLSLDPEKDVIQNEKLSTARQAPREPVLRQRWLDFVRSRLPGQSVVEPTRAGA